MQERSHQDVLQECSGTYSTQTAARSPLFGKRAQCSPSLCLPCGMMCKTQLLSSSTALLGGFGDSPSLGVSRQSLELFVWIEGSEGSLGESPLLESNTQTLARSSAEASPVTGLATAH